MKIKQCFSNNNNLNIAFEESTKNIPENSDLILFFSSSKYDFKELSKLYKEKFVNTKIIGTTTNGEIGEKICFGENNLLTISFIDFNAEMEVCVINQIKTEPILSILALQKSMDKLKLTRDDYKNCFGLFFVDGLASSEEKTLSILEPMFNAKFSLIGGSAGDSSLKNTYISYDGEVYQNTAILLLVKTNIPFKVFKENIYEPSKHNSFKITKANIEERTVYEINGEKALDFYANLLGKNSNDITNEDIFYHPLGYYTLNKELYINSIMTINKNDKSIKFYANIKSGQTMRLLNPVDIMSIAKNTVNTVKAETQKPAIMLCFNCILRYMQIKQEGLEVKLYNEYKKISDNVVGFTTLGEQHYFKHCNQTLTFITIEGDNL